MNIIEPKVLIVSDGLENIAKKIEWCGRKCYKSEDRITKDSAVDFLKTINGYGHLSVMEHSSVTACFIIDRGISHELVRHRIAAFSQESSRYCNYSNNKFGNEITYIKPFYFDIQKYTGDGSSPIEFSPNYFLWVKACADLEHIYMEMIANGASPQEARSILPNSLKTEVASTFNMREWKHVFTMRCSKAAHPQMRQVMIPTLLKFRELFPVIYDDVPYDEDFPKQVYAEVELVNI